MLVAPPLSLYVHLPWCVRKCPYCDFNSYGLRDALPEARYGEALERDLAAQAPEVADRPVVSVFFGGGTPSLFSPAAIGRVIDAARRNLAIAPDAEVTLEANPGTVERGCFAEYRAGGVTRVSLGAQSFDPRQLRTLGRIQSGDETRRAAEELHAAGLENFNLDLMYGLPGQDVAGARRDVEEALALDPAHVSHYQLTIEPGTVFAARPPVLPEDDVIDAMLAACQERLADAGFMRYEISAYARVDRRCRHNVNYWRFGDYLGVGAGAHGKLTDATAGRIRRTWQLREPRRYLAMAPDARSQKSIAPDDLPFEFMMNALRLVEGFETADFASFTGLGWAAAAATVGMLEQRGLVIVSRGRCRASALGLRFLNDVVGSFLPPRAQRTLQGTLSTAAAIAPARYTQALGAATANERITCETGQVAE
ncbi:MAG: radical SAM family heme chaperone HemW [Gammaproteobacteria bacterium]